MENDNVGVKLHQTMDANIWAQEFMKIWAKQIYQTNGECIDLDLMRAWFANSIMCGWDHAHWKLDPYQPQKEIK